MAKEKTEKIRATLFIDPLMVNDLDYIARSEAVKQNKSVSRTDIIAIALEEYKQRWEKKNGEIPVK